MPLKVRCRSCEKVLNVPDRARGKAVRCPNCESTIRIPAGNTGGSRQRTQESRRRVRRKAPVPRGGENFLDGVDLRRAADTHVRICAKCGVEADEEVIDCPECGHNVDTGIMSEYMRQKRARRGPDPEEFWGEMWSEPWGFLKKNVPLVFRTASIWAFFQSFQIASFYISQDVASKTALVFWAILGAFSTLGVGGWIWLTITRVIRHTMGAERNKKFKDTNFDAFECFALGYKSNFWVFILFYSITLALSLAYLLPVAMAEFLPDSIPIIVFDSYLPLIISFSMILPFCLWVFPIAMIHMSMPYTYKAWLPVNMSVITARNILPTLYWHLVFFTVFSPIIIVLLAFQFAYPAGLAGVVLDVVDWINTTCNEMSVYIVVAFGLVGGWFGGLVGLVFKRFLFMLMIFIFLLPVCMILSFPLVYSMRANGLVAYYFRGNLELVTEQTADTPCGFGPRYLAALVDSLVMFLLVGVLILIAHGAGWLFTLMGALVPAFLAFIVYPIASAIIVPCLYFANPQSSKSIRASIGKWSLGLVVTKEDGDAMSFQEAVLRYFTKVLLAAPTLGATFIMSAFTANKQALHDQLSNTKVTWKGDDERRLYE